ncbi:MAG: hypothetical protein HOI89_11050 [Phycisphaerae bacterium]|nr:hypothetical protein [Phycisphaerae bacterium]MBT5658307.1 hypothetical protein [Phycisphaerae bacterium]
MQVPLIFCIITVVAIAGCGEPIDTSGLSGQEASLAAEGSADMREQDGTMGDQTLDTLSGAGAPPPDPFDPDPFITRERIDRTSTLDESNVAPGASTLEPGPESLTGDPMDQPAVNVQDE